LALQVVEGCPGAGNHLFFTSRSKRGARPDALHADAPISGYSKGKADLDAVVASLAAPRRARYCIDSSIAMILCAEFTGFWSGTRCKAVRTRRRDSCSAVQIRGIYGAPLVIFNPVGRPAAVRARRVPKARGTSLVRAALESARRSSPGAVPSIAPKYDGSHHAA
jgi:hypothetical protein